MEIVFFVTLVISVIFVFIITSIVKRCYLLAPGDTAIVKTGLKPDMVSTKGMLVFPVIDQVQFVSLGWQEIRIEFAGDDRLRFSDKQSQCVASLWIAQSTQDDLIIAAARSFGERCNHPQLFCDLYRDSMRHAITKAARSTTYSQWADELPSINADLMIAFNETLEKFHVIKRVSIALSDTSDGRSKNDEGTSGSSK